MGKTVKHTEKHKSRLDQREMHTKFFGRKTRHHKDVSPELTYTCNAIPIKIQHSRKQNEDERISRKPLLKRAMNRVNSIRILKHITELL